MDFETQCLHAVPIGDERTGAIAVPIFQSATFAHPGFGLSTGYDYTRSQNPTRQYVEDTLRELERGCDAIAFSSGMAAVSATMELFAPGEGIVATEDLYGGSIRLFNTLGAKRSLGITYVDTSDIDHLAKAITPSTKAVFIETPTNPLMRVSDIALIKSILPEGVLLIVDNTFLTPYFQRPLELGADIVIHSATKYLGGHNDTLAGFAVLADDDLAKRLRLIQMTTGANLAPFDCFLIARGIKTLPIRMQRSQENAMEIAGFLKSHPRVTAVHYPGLEDDPSYEVSKRQASGFGSMLSFRVDSSETAVRVLGSTSVIFYAESLGGVESLLTYPYTQTHADVPEAERRARGIDETLLRLSVGIESARDLIEDLNRALG